MNKINFYKWNYLPNL